MSLLEGHGDVTMDRAGADQIPIAERFGRVLRQRRQQANGLAKLLQQLIGLEAKLNQYEQGERFIEAVEAVGGPTLLDRCWEDPEQPADPRPRSATPPAWIGPDRPGRRLGRRPWASADDLLGPLHVPGRRHRR